MSRTRRSLRPLTRSVKPARPATELSASNEPIHSGGVGWFCPVSTVETASTSRSGNGYRRNLATRSVLNCHGGPLSMRPFNSETDSVTAPTQPRRISRESSEISWSATCWAERRATGDPSEIWWVRRSLQWLGREGDVDSTYGHRHLTFDHRHLRRDPSIDSLGQLLHRCVRNPHHRQVR